MIEMAYYLSNYIIMFPNKKGIEYLTLLPVQNYGN